MKTDVRICGIDYGSQMAGTTRICFNDGDQLHIAASEKKKSADQFILQFFENEEFSIVGLDAPSSLPAAYYKAGSDFHYREADRAVQAMSPMFLGGLTARAMQLRAQLQLRCVEVYPGARVRNADALKECYSKKDKQSIPAVIEILERELHPLQLPALNDYHDIDSVLAWWIAHDVLEEKAHVAGKPSEGLIYY